MGIESTMAKINPIVAASEAVTNPLFAHLTNVKNRKFAREQYQTQRQDNLKDWAMTNEYNSPRAQMQRYREAGLNPNLIYGQMQTATPIKEASNQGAQASAPQSSGSRDISNALMASAGLENKDAQTAILNKQMEMFDYQKKLMTAQAYNQIASAGRSDAETKQIMQSMGFQAENQPFIKSGLMAGVELVKANIKNVEVQTTRHEQEIEKVKAETISVLDSNKRNWELQKGALSLQQAQLANYMSEVLRRSVENAKTKQDIENLKLAAEGMKDENIVKAVTAGHSLKSGETPSDNFVMKLLQRAGSLFDGKKKPVIYRQRTYQATDSH
jgi:hypothetical protein